MIVAILNILSGIVILYTIMCFIDIIMSWLPGAKFTSFGRFISKICDPWLKLFTKNGLIRVGNFDFTPIISIGILSLLSSILGGITATGVISFGRILGSILNMVWSLASTLLTILFILTLVRWIVLLLKKNTSSYQSGWYQIDTIIRKFCDNVCYFFTKKRYDYRKTLMINWIAFLSILIILNVLFRLLISLCYRIPF